MILKDISFQTPQENILYDDVLLAMSEEGLGGEVLRFWESEEVFIVLGRICKENEDLKINTVKKDRIPVLRRSSGGGTVVQGKGCFNYTLILSKDNNSQISDIRKSYEFILRKCIEALNLCNVEAAFYPVSDIAFKENKKKISGNAQKRGKKYILHHGTLLYDFNLELIERYLEIPKSIPDYREQREHLDFVANVDVPVEEIKKSFKRVFNVKDEQPDILLNEKEWLLRFMQSKMPTVSLNK